MGNFNRDDRRGGGRSGGGFGGRGFDRPKFQTVCSDCGNACEVPFKPTGERPVFCNDCFRKHGKGGAERPTVQSFGGQQKQGGSGNQGMEQFKAQFEALNSKLDKILKVLMPTVSATVPVVAKTKSASKKTVTKKKK